MPENTSPQNPQLEIYREKQKTIRKAITYAVILIISVLVLFLGGRFKFGKDGIEISKDILQTTDQNKTTSNNGDFTTGELNDDAKKFIEKNKQQINPGSFSGKNYINNELGYLFSVEHPEKWNITYQKENAGVQDFVDRPVNRIEAGDGIQMKISIVNNTDEETFDSIAGAFYMLFAELAKNDPSVKPEISYDKPTQTAFFNGVHVQNYKRVLMKIILKNGKAYFGYIEYPKELEDDERVKELKHMVATLTVI
ncbi:MAG: hypothetical protein ACOVP7_09020 [Lacibacter sp.]